MKTRSGTAYITTGMAFGTWGLQALPGRAVLPDSVTRSKYFLGRIEQQAPRGFDPSLPRPPIFMHSCI